MNNENKKPKESLLVRMQMSDPIDITKAKFVEKYYRRIVNWCREGNCQVVTLYHKTMQPEKYGYHRCRPSDGCRDVIFSVEIFQKNDNNLIGYIELLKKYIPEFYDNIIISVIADNREQFDIKSWDIHFSTMHYCVYIPEDIAVCCNCIPYLGSSFSSFNDHVVSMAKAFLCFKQGENNDNNST
jgi:hypothetical protein